VNAAPPELIRDFLEEESERTSYSSARNVWAVISAFCTWARKRDLLADNPCVKVEKPKPEDRPVTTLSPKEVSSLLKLVVEHYDREVLTYTLLSLFGGLRPHEFVTEQRDGTWVHLAWAAIGKTYIAMDRRLGKTRKARQIPINDTLKEWLQPEIRS
jgi:integrase